LLHDLIISTAIGFDCRSLAASLQRSIHIKMKCPLLHDPVLLKTMDAVKHAVDGETAILYSLVSRPTASVIPFLFIFLLHVQISATHLDRTVSARVK
jgi:hypothetical protein